MGGAFYFREPLCQFVVDCPGTLHVQPFGVLRVAVECQCRCVGFTSGGQHGVVHVGCQRIDDLRQFGELGEQL